MKSENITILFVITGILALISERSLAQIPSNVCNTWFRIVQTQNGSPLKVYSTPNGQIIGSVPNKSEVLFNTGDARRIWSEILAKGGLTGWVKENNLQLSADHSSEFKGTMRVKTLESPTISIRSSPSLSAQRIGFLKKGEVVKYNTFVGYFANITSSKGIRGFVSSQYLVCN